MVCESMIPRCRSFRRVVFSCDVRAWTLRRWWYSQLFQQAAGHAAVKPPGDAEVRYLTERWHLLPGEDQSAGFLLDDLLTAQERLAAEEFDYVSAQVAYTVSLSELKRANGTLLQAEQLEMKRSEVDGLPGLTVEKRPAEQ